MLAAINKSLKIIPRKKLNENFIINEDFIKEEYTILSTYLDSDLDHQYSCNPGKTELDRYSDIKCYAHNIIKINNGKGYINASPINIITKKYFISTQAPKKETIEDFCTMIIENKCKIIIMLCKQIENNKEKCALYWEGETSKFSIKSNEIEVEMQYIIREIEIINKKSNKKEKITQINYTGWPDHGIPDASEKNFESFCKIMTLAEKYKGNFPITIHCSAGVGRTGTFISMYYLNKEIVKQINNNSENIQFNIFNLVRKLKEMRMFLVQVFEQYKFIYLFVDYLLKKLNI